MRDLVPLPPPRRELFTDDRGGGLRVSWHPGDGLVVISLWKSRPSHAGVEDVCIGTVRLPVTDAARLSTFLSGHLDLHACGGRLPSTGDGQLLTREPRAPTGSG
jgi:hypothetical protein